MTRGPFVYVIFETRRGLRSAGNVIEFWKGKRIDDLSSRRFQFRDGSFEIRDDARVGVFRGERLAEHAQPRALESVLLQCSGIGWRNMTSIFQCHWIVGIGPGDGV